MWVVLCFYVSVCRVGVGGIGWSGFIFEEKYPIPVTFD